MIEEKIMRNFESDFSYIETFGKNDPNKGFVPIVIPENIDFEIEFWVNEGNGATFKASRIGGYYKYCKKTDASTIRIYIPLSRWSLGEGDLCRKLRVRFPGQGWNGELAEICVPQKTNFYLCEGPSDDSNVGTEIQEIFSGAFKGQDGISAYYLIHTKKVVDAAGGVDLGTVIEGLSEADLVELSDEAKYRLCLVRFRKGEDSGRSWHIPALPYFRAARIGKPIAPNTHKIAEEHTWWPVTGREVAWFRGANIVDVLPMGINESQHRFKNSKNLKMRDGVALFKYTGGAGEGWTRVSNIAYVESYLCDRNKADKEPRVIISVKM